jgi:hypothetical protein
MIKIAFKGQLVSTQDFDADKAHFNELGQIFELLKDKEVVALVPSSDVLWLVIEQEAEVLA